MRIALHVHHLEQLDHFRDPLVDLILTEPFFSYKHPYVTDRAAFLALLQNALKTGQAVYVEINGFIEEGDLDGLKTWIQELITLPITGFYFADWSVLMFLKELGYLGQTIYAPETILTNTLEAQTLLKAVDRIQLSKELTLAESVALCQALPNRIELFGAGHLQMSVSRRPLLSSYLAHLGQSKSVLNQTNYRIRELKRKEKMPVLEETKTFCVFTQDILNPLEELPQLTPAYSLHLDPLFIQDDAATAFFRLILDQDKAYDSLRNEAFYTSTPYLPLFKGYFYRKTNLGKEGV